LKWAAAFDAISHDVYFGLDNPPPFIRNQTTTTFEPGYLPEDTTYYWRIDEVNDVGTTTGTVWSFTTGEGPKSRCFPADTIVWVDGEMREISKVVAGGMVDKPAVARTITSLQNTVCSSEIEEVVVHDDLGSWERYDISLENGNSLVVADSHYFLLASGDWVSSLKLKAGSKLQTLEGTVAVKSIVKSAARSAGVVYNLKIKGGERYLVGKDGIIVRDW
jgi:hypothetical protein